MSRQGSLRDRRFRRSQERLVVEDSVARRCEMRGHEHNDIRANTSVCAWIVPNESLGGSRLVLRIDRIRCDLIGC